MHELVAGRRRRAARARRCRRVAACRDRRSARRATVRPRAARSDRPSDVAVTTRRSIARDSTNRWSVSRRPLHLAAGVERSGADGGVATTTSTRSGPSIAGPRLVGAVDRPHDRMAQCQRPAGLRIDEQLPRQGVGGTVERSTRRSVAPDAAARSQLTRNRSPTASAEDGPEQRLAEPVGQGRRRSRSRRCRASTAPSGTPSIARSRSSVGDGRALLGRRARRGWRRRARRARRRRGERSARDPRRPAARRDHRARIGCVSGESTCA